nr:pre mRNA processing factor 39 [Hymenolepis microstoma]
MSLTDRLWRKVNLNVADFNSWVNLLDAAEKQPNIDVTRKAFDSFLQHFPYCYGYWKKYAILEKLQGNKDRCLEIFRKGVEAIPLSIDLWVAYLEANLDIINGFDNFETRMRSLYEVALEKAGLEFRSDALWEHYLSWEAGHNRWGHVLSIYDRLLRTPTQLYFQNWDSFKKMIEENRPEDYLPVGEFAELLARVSPVAGTTMRIALKESKSDTVPFPDITESDRIAIRKLVIDRREKVYQATYLQIMKRWFFEEKIRRPYFHVKPLEEAQLNNWAEYLSFEESEAASAEAVLNVPVTEGHSVTEPQITIAEVQLAKKRVRILYERCLVACALYEHLWIRYAKYLEYTECDLPGAREVWRRACCVHLRTKPTIHWHWALFESRHSTEVVATDNDSEETPKSITPLEIFTDLEKRLIDSALVCDRRADAMRREGKPLLDQIVCLRSGINRLRVRSTEQTSLAHSVTGATASFSAAIALATAAQARAGASYLVGKLARLLHCNAGNQIPPEGLPLWQLLLSSSFHPSKTPLTKNSTEEDDSKVNADQEGDLPVDDHKSSKEKPKPEELKHEEEPTTVEMEVDDLLEDAIPETVSAPTENGTDGGSPPLLISNKKKSPKSTEVVSGDGEERDKSSSDESVREEPSAAKRRRSRWGDVKGETDKDLEEIRAAEAERLARADLEAKAYAQERAAITEVKPPSDISTLPADQMRLISPEEAAIAVLLDGIEFDPRNERLYSQLLDIAYQRRPMDVSGFLKFANLAIVDSILPATIKLGFAQRKLQFLEMFCNDINEISAAYDEYLQLAQLVVQSVMDGPSEKKLHPHGLGVGIDGARAYSTPDLLNVALPAPLRPSARRNPVTNGPVRRMPQTDRSAAIMADAASVGVNLAPSGSDTASSIRFTAGAYEHIAGPLTGGLPPPAPTMVPIAAGAMPGTEAVEVWRGLEPAGYAAAVASGYASGGGTFYAPIGASSDATASVQAPPPALMTHSHHHESGSV